MPVNVTAHISVPNCTIFLRHLRVKAESLLKELHVQDHSVCIVLTDDIKITQLNSRYRGKDTATNVLSFAFSESVDDTLSMFDIADLGDIFISLDTARKEAEEHGQSIFRRLDWLLTHGMLHLLGFDHEKSVADAEKMYNKEVDLLAKIANNRRQTMPQLAINVDHVATVRQARGGIEPDPVTAAAICEMAGASGIVIHLREDRRHIQDKDVYLLRKTVKTKLNLEMGANKEIIDIALDVVPDMITLVPEKREELTTEGGLDVVSQQKKLAKVIKKFTKASIPVSIFVDPDFDQIQASYDIGAKYVEIHTGRYCDAVSEEDIDKEFDLIASASEEAYSLGLVVNGGHGLDYHNTGRIAALDKIDELSIGHAVICRAIFSGLETAVRDMLKIIQNAQMQLY